MGAVGNHECGGANLQHYARRFGGLQEAAKNSNAKTAGSTAKGDALWYSWVGTGQKSRSFHGPLSRSMGLCQGVPAST